MVNVNAGISGFQSTIKINSDDMQNAIIQFETECPNLKPMKQELKGVDGFQECFSKGGASAVYEKTGKYCKHTACPGPMAIIKGIEVACGLALPKYVIISIRKEDT